MRKSVYIILLVVNNHDRIKQRRSLRAGRPLGVRDQELFHTSN
jgi:hypothetical protein